MEHSLRVYLVPFLEKCFIFSKNKENVEKAFHYKKKKPIVVVNDPD